MTGTYQTMLDAAFRSGTPPDLFMPDVPGGLPKLVELGWVIPLEEVASSKGELERWMALFPPGQQPFVGNLNVFDGKTYSWPAAGQGAYMMLYYNTKLFREAGLRSAGGEASAPQSWAQVRQSARKLTELGQGRVYGIVHGIKNSEVWVQDVNLSFAAAAGWDHNGPDWRTGRFNFHNPGFRGAILLWLDMKSDGSIFPGDLGMDDEQAKFRFSEDLAGMLVGGSWVPGGILAINESLEFDTELPPTETGSAKRGGVSIGPLAGMSEYAVSSKVQSKDAVWRVIQFLTSGEFQDGWVKAGGGISVFPEYNKPEYFPHPTIAKIAQLGGEGRRTTPRNLLSPNAYRVAIELLGESVGQPAWHEVMQGIWIGKLGTEGWDDLERRYNDALDRALAKAAKEGMGVTRADFTFPDWDPFENYPPPKEAK